MKLLIVIMGLVMFLDITSLTIMLSINVNELRNIRRYLRNEQEEKEIQEAMQEEIEIL